MIRERLTLHVQDLAFDVGRISEDVSNLVPSSRNGNENLRDSDFIQFLEDVNGDKISEVIFLGFNSLKRMKIVRKIASKIF